MGDEIKLVEPSTDYIVQIENYRSEFLEHNDSMDGTSSLRKYENIYEWLDWIELAKNKETCSKNWVPDIQYLCVRKSDNRLIGMIDIRLELNDECLKYYGNIGYSIRFSERKKGYATKQLALALKVCKNRGMQRVLITCDKLNQASAKIIQHNGGKIENEIFDPNDQTVTQRFWIDLEHTI